MSVRHSDLRERAGVRGLGEADSWAVRSKVINKAIQDIGMGRYNWQLFVLCGFGWFADKYVPNLQIRSF